MPPKGPEWLEENRRAVDQRFRSLSRAHALLDTLRADELFEEDWAPLSDALRGVELAMDRIRPTTADQKLEIDEFVRGVTQRETERRRAARAAARDNGDAGGGRGPVHATAEDARRP